jgi:hypothetical protein
VEGVLNPPIPADEELDPPIPDAAGGRRQTLEQEFPVIRPIRRGRDRARRGGRRRVEQPVDRPSPAGKGTGEFIEVIGEPGRIEERGQTHVAESDQLTADLRDLVPIVDALPPHEIAPD